MLAAAAVMVCWTDATVPFGWKERARGLASLVRRPARCGETGAAVSVLTALSPVAIRPVTLAAVIRSEWIKARSVRSIGIVAAFTVALIVAVGLIATADTDWAAALFIDALIASLAAFPGGQALLGSHGTSLAVPVALRAVVRRRCSSPLRDCAWAAGPGGQVTTGCSRRR
jgi:hypothetical protein